MANGELEHARQIRRQMWNEGRVRRNGWTRHDRDGVEADVWVLGRDEEHCARVEAARDLFARFRLTGRQQEQFLMSLIATLEGNEQSERLAAMSAN